MNSKKKALFFPSFSGRGFGHIHRCLALANELSLQDWQTGFVLAGPNSVLVKDKGYPLYQPQYIRHPSTKFTRSPAYSFIYNGNGQVLRDGLTRPWRVWLSVNESIRFVKHYHPDVLIGDSSLLTWIVGQRMQLPVVQIIQSIIHPQNPQIIWWQEAPINEKPIDICPVFNPLLKHWNMNSIKQSEDLLKGDIFLIPGIPATDPLPDWITNTHYVGPLIVDQSQDFELPDPFNNPRGRPIIFVTLGGSANPELIENVYTTIGTTMSDSPGWVVMSVGGNFPTKELTEFSPNVFCFRWLPGWAAIQNSSAIVFHGGHTTMMETLIAGIPAVVIPSHSEQESNGRRLEACSAAVVISPSQDRERMQLVHDTWSYGEFTSWIVPEFSPDPEELKKSIDKIIKDSAYQKGAQSLKNSALHYGGAKASVELIKEIVT